MSWFHYTKQERVAQNRALRRQNAEQARKEAGDNVFLIPHIIKDVLRNAADEGRMFEDYLGEPMPPHVQRAFDLEVALWKRLDDSIKGANKRNMSEADYATYAERIRSYLVPLIDLLHAEEEMITSCLVKHYDQITAALRDAAQRIPL